jgi:hypothetical protein
MKNKIVPIYDQVKECIIISSSSAKESQRGQYFYTQACKFLDLERCLQKIIHVLYQAIISLLRQTITDSLNVSRSITSIYAIKKVAH